MKPKYSNEDEKELNKEFNEDEKSFVDTTDTQPKSSLDDIFECDPYYDDDITKPKKKRNFKFSFHPLKTKKDHLKQEDSLPNDPIDPIAEPHESVENQITTILHTDNLSFSDKEESLIQKDPLVVDTSDEIATKKPVDDLKDNVAPMEEEISISEPIHNYVSTDESQHLSDLDIPFGLETTDVPSPPVEDEDEHASDFNPLEFQAEDELDSMQNLEPATSPDFDQSEPTKKSKRRRCILNSIIVTFLVLVLVGGVSGFAILYSIVSKVDAQGLTQKMVSKDSSVFYASDGKTVIGELGGESRENITYEQVPQSTIDAFLAIEDSRFYKHNGFDLPRFMSSALHNLRSQSLSQGGSTLTMQAVDNFVMKPIEKELRKKGSVSKLKSIEMKIQEIWLSMQVEKELSKKEIMTKYLNEINFGQHTRGIQKGAQYYFGKNVEDLNLSESAFLAGVINAPNSYNPYRGVENGVNHYRYAQERRDTTLYQMLNHGYITQTEYNLAKSTKLAFLVNGQLDNTATDPYKDYVRAAADEIIKKYNVDPATTPMNIYTALDINAQKAANHASSGNVVNLKYNKYFQIAFTLMDNKTGEIRAVSAGRGDLKTTSNIERYRFNEAHQPGSSVKPILAYAPSFDKLGYSTSRVFMDKEISIDGWKVVNADGKYNDKVSMERAIAQSLNVPAVQTYEELLKKVGQDEMIKYNNALGFDPRVSSKVNIQYAIGASHMTATPTQMAAAFASLANKGTYIEPHMVRKIVYKDKDKTIEANVAKQQVMSPQAAYMTSDLLYKAVNGKDKNLNLMGSLGFGKYPVYGKTGTSDWAEYADKYGGRMKDEWMINYTSEYTIATWSGFDGGIAGGNTFISEELLYRNIPGYINKYMLDTLLTGKEKQIENPGGISNFDGGFIKDEWLQDAKKNNPLTIENSKTNNDALKAALEAALKLNENDFSIEAYKVLQDAIKQAQKILENDLAPQEDIDKALNDLAIAQNGMNAQAAKRALQNAIHAAAVDRNRYTSNSLARLDKALNDAYVLMNKENPTQEEINAQIQAIQNAKNALEEQPSIYKGHLAAVINGARALKASDYTADSYAQFMAIVNDGLTVYYNPNSSQAEIDARASAITYAQTYVLKLANKR